MEKLPINNRMTDVYEDVKARNKINEIIDFVLSKTKDTEPKKKEKPKDV